MQQHERLIIFGASGLLGSRLTDEALRRGYHVTAVARRASQIDDRDGQITTAAADATEEQQVAALAAGHRAALSAITQHDQPEVLVAVAHALLNGLEQAGVEQLIVAGGAGSLLVANGTRLVDTPEFHDEWKPEALAQAAALDVYRNYRGPIRWSYLSPAALLEPGERTGRYRTGGDHLLTDERGRSRITMEDVAIAMLDEMEHPRHPRQRFTAAH